MGYLTMKMCRKVNYLSYTSTLKYRPLYPTIAAYRFEKNDATHRDTILPIASKEITKFAANSRKGWNVISIQQQFNYVTVQKTPYDLVWWDIRLKTRVIPIEMNLLTGHKYTSKDIGIVNLFIYRYTYV